MKKTWIVTIIFLSSHFAWSENSSLFERCQNVFLSGKTIQNLIDEEQSKSNQENIDQKYIAKLKTLNNSQSCLKLLEQAQLKTNGLLIERTPLGSIILKSLVDFHHNWLMPKDYDKPIQCQDPFNNDVFDPLGPAYHLTRALFQKDRNASVAITSFGDLRSMREGENPKKSTETSLTSENYQNVLGLNDPLDLVGDSPLVGFLYKGQVFFEKVAPINWSQTNGSWDKSREQKKLKLFNHLGGGLMGSPSYLIHYAPSQAFNSELYKSDGQTLLPRKLALGILNGILCKEPSQISLNIDYNISDKWNHPITSEKKCLSCHTPLDHFAAGFRHLTFLKNQENCSKDNPQILIPTNFETSYSKDVWQSKEKDTKPFSFSYPAGLYEKERFVGFNQLGRVLAQRPEFYQCQVKKYYSFIFNQDIEDGLMISLAKEYQEHQDGLKLMQDLFNHAPKDLKK
ncbi:MAG: hypothetical protein K9K67_10620 [Bacteriovoracaceae bacterium]|nr:hypothetical protein [Bacteriovoracaceae bacterium]